jgi:hypothetical protein
MNYKRLQPAEAQRFLRALFNGAEIATFEYWADFIVRLEREVPRDQQEIERELLGGVPSVLWLRLEADWWVGDRQTMGGRSGFFSHSGASKIFL